MGSDPIPPVLSITTIVLPSKSTVVLIVYYLAASAEFMANSLSNRPLFSGSDLTCATSLPPSVSVCNDWSTALQKSVSFVTSRSILAVSYTHLTLPTIYPV